MRRWQLVVVALTLLSACGADWGHFRARPPCLPGLPCYDYQYQERSASKEALSTFGNLLETALPAAAPNFPGPKIRYYQLDRAQIQVDHCILSRLALTLHQDGSWILSGRADQNPWMGPDTRQLSPLKSSGPLVVKHTEHLKRNQFFVKVRCYSAFAVKETMPGASTGKPALTAITLPPFWVQRGEPYDLMVRGSLADVGLYFHLIDRVEVEFYYR